VEEEGLLKIGYHKVRAGALRAVCRVSPALLARLRYRTAWGRWPDFRNPVTYDEKLLWLNLYWPDPLKTECGDKYTMRGYVQRHGLDRLLPRLYGVYETAQAIDFSALPRRFVLKCTHGCKCNVFCWDKASLETGAARRVLARALVTDFSTLLGELHYARMVPRILCEELLDDGSGGLPTDYKVFCFNGEPRWILCYTGRKPNDKGKRALVDINWNPTTLLRGEVTVPPPRSPVLEEFLSASRTLSAPFPFVRIDFYCIAGRPVLGEMTFTPNACINRDYAQHEMAAHLVLPATPIRQSPESPSAGVLCGRPRAQECNRLTKSSSFGARTSATRGSSGRESP
jgi:hypothetical protein